MNVTRCARHLDYNEPTLLNNDVAVLILSEPLTFSSTIGSAALADSLMELPAGTMVNISGFGSTVLGSSKTAVLHFVIVPIVSQKQCKIAYEKYPGFAKLTNNMICAGFYGMGGKDSCNTDSGGMFKFHVKSRMIFL